MYTDNILPAYSVSYVSDHDCFKAEREKTGLTVRKFSDLVDISSSSLFYYENGTNKILNLKVDKAIEIFSHFELTLDAFCHMWYQDVYDNAQNSYQQWKIDHPRELSYTKLHSKYKALLVKYNSRYQFTEDVYRGLYNHFLSVFDCLKDRTDDLGFINDDCYEEYIIPLSYEISRTIDSLSRDPASMLNPVSANIHDLILKSDLYYKDLAAIIGVTPRLLSLYHNSEEGYSNIKLSLAIKIASIFDTPVLSLFSDC